MESYYKSQVKKNLKCHVDLLFYQIGLSATADCERDRKIVAMRVIKNDEGALRELNPGPLAPETRIIPLDQVPLCKNAPPQSAYERP